MLEVIKIIEEKDALEDLIIQGEREMDWRKWLKSCGVHAIICGAVFAVAFGINHRINLKQDRIYTVLKDSDILYEITDFIQKNRTITIKGWGFSPNYYNAENVHCELILENTETKEAVWPKMEKNPETQNIEKRYSDGDDYSRGSFEGKIGVSKLEDTQVYEILLRYTSDYIDEKGDKQEYTRTISTGEFLSDRTLTDYNPKTFVAPEIAGSGLQKDLEGTRLFHYFPEGMWIYYNNQNIYYIVENAFLEQNPLYLFPLLLWQIKNDTDSSENHREYEKEYNGFDKDDNRAYYTNLNAYQVWVVKMPSNNIIRMEAGIHSYEEKTWLLFWDAQIKGEKDE